MFPASDDGSEGEEIFERAEVAGPESADEVVGRAGAVLEMLFDFDETLLVRAAAFGDW